MCNDNNAAGDDVLQLTYMSRMVTKSVIMLMMIVSTVVAAEARPDRPVPAADAGSPPGDAELPARRGEPGLEV